MNYIKLMYITNDPQIALIAEKAGVDRIFVDMEYIGKEDRQGGMDTVQSHHTIDDIKAIKSVLTKSELMVRCNPIHDATSQYSSSEDEIQDIIDSGADIIMLPYFKSAAEVKRFVSIVDGRAKTFPLVETKEAAECIDEILEIDGIDEIYIGLNDLSLSYGKRFMFELLSDGTVEALCHRFKEKGIAFGFGGIASVGKGLLPSEYIIKEHLRIGSTSVILSRSFCDLNKVQNISDIKPVFEKGVEKIRGLESECSVKDSAYFENNKNELTVLVKNILQECK